MESKKGYKLFVENSSKELTTFRNNGLCEDDKEIESCDLQNFTRDLLTGKIMNISILDLSNCGLKDFSHLHRLPHLTQLVLSHNQLEEIPSCLYTEVGVLERLDLSHNQIRNFDVEPKCCETLAALFINNNLIYNFPQWILAGRCSNLLEIVYSHNQIRKLKTGHNLSVKKLSMSNCQLIDDDFGFIKKLVSLEYLDLSNSPQIRQGVDRNNFRDVDKLFESAAAEWVNLRVLILDYLQISILPPSLFWVTSLVELHLRHCDLTWIPDEIQYLVSLEVIDISNNEIITLGQSLTDLEHLRVLIAANNGIGSVTNTFKSKLQVLDLYHNDLITSPHSELIKEIDLIDLEYNGFECDDEEYKKKVATYRLNYCGGEEREFGCFKAPSTRSYESSTPTSYGSDDGLDGDYNTTNNIEIGDFDTETWDDYDNKEMQKTEVGKETSYERNPMVSTSDEEWQGLDSVTRRKKCASTPMKYNYSTVDDWMHCDADEL